MLEAPVFPTRSLVATALLVILIGLGVAGYAWIEGWSWFDALYMTVTTITTVGGGEARPLSPAGRWFTLVLIILGVGLVFYALIAWVEFLLEGQLRAAVGSRRMRHHVRHLDNHLVLCGYGRVGREIVHQFVAEGVRFVVIDVNQDSLADAVQQGYSVVFGNAAEIEVLEKAGIDRARGLVTAVDSDADNIYVTLSARVLRPDLFIVARALPGWARPWRSFRPTSRRSSSSL